MNEEASCINSSSIILKIDSYFKKVADNLF
jgi:hypothetical protein